MSPANIIDLNLYDGVNLESITPIKNGIKLSTVMTVAGSDSSGGAGIEADIKTITEHKCYALTSIVCLTAQNTTGVSSAYASKESTVSSILDENFSDIPIDSIKTGLLTPESIPALKNAIEKFEYKGYLVIDPVMGSTSGYDFVKSDVLKLIVDALSSYATLITPNMIEAKALLNTLLNEHVYSREPIESIEKICDMCLKIHNLTGIKNILIKGGHQKWSTNSKLLTDILYCSSNNTYYIMRSEMLNSKHTHGTGCSLSSSIASNLANGLSIVNAVANGIAYVQNGIKSAPQLGNGNGPLNHIQNFQLLNYEARINDFKLPFEKENALNYFYNHPTIAESWEKYTSHSFMKLMGNYKIKLETFISFVEQNLLYMINYQHALGYLLTKLTSIEDMNATINKMNIVVSEISKLKSILQLAGYNEPTISSIKATNECKEYMDKLSELAKYSGDLLDIQVAILPCYYGCHLSCNNARKEMESIENPDLNDSRYKLFPLWLDGITSEEYSKSSQTERSILNNHVWRYCKSEVKLNRIIEIFRTFTELENKFLDSFVVNYES